MWSTVDALGAQASLPAWLGREENGRQQKMQAGCLRSQVQLAALRIASSTSSSPGRKIGITDLR